MSPVTAAARYDRVEDVLWRDTGRRVVALAAGTTDVQVLGGGAAAVWRLVDGPSSVAQIVQQVEEVYGQGPGVEDVLQCLGGLVDVGLLRQLS